MRNRMYGGVRGRKMKVGGKLLHFPPTRLYADGLFTPFCHFLCKGLFTVLADVTDTGRSVTPENECEELSYEIVMKPTILNVHHSRTAFAYP